MSLKKAKKTIDYQAFMAGALLFFDMIDPLDLSLLLEDFQKKAKITVTGSWDNMRIDLIKFITTDERIRIKLKSPLNSFIENDNCTLEEKLYQIAGLETINYFKNLDRDSFYKLKEQARNKDNVLNNSNVLLITDNEEEYNKLVRYGFKNIHWFKSLVRADKYYSEHPEKLSNYHLVINGTSHTQYYYLGRELDIRKRLKELSQNQDMLVVPLFYYDNKGIVELEPCLYDQINSINYPFWVTSFDDLFELIIDNVAINRININQKDMGDIKDYKDAERLPLPTKKADLKILYLDTTGSIKYDKEIGERLGLDITFMEDNGFSLPEVRNHLGEYDIIIASDKHSSRLLDMAGESTEQCKDTGRNLVLLATYDNNEEEKETAKIVVNSIMAGYLADDNLINHHELTVQTEDFNYNDIAVTVAIINFVLGIYKSRISMIENGYLNNNKDSIDVRKLTKNRRNYE